MKTIIITICLIFFSQITYADNCSSIKIHNSVTWTSVKRFVSEYYKSNSVKFRSLFALKNWYIAEIESKDFEPLILVFKKTTKGYDVKVEWGGMVEESDSRNAIINYFKNEVPEVPNELLKCFVPKGPPFIKKE
jgi:hypothetical protein